MSDEPKPRKVPRGKPPEGYKRMPSISQRIAGLAEDGEAPAGPNKPGALIKGLGTPSPRTPATKPAPIEQAPEVAAFDAMAQMKAAFLNNINTPLRAKSGLPTLAERIAVEGAAAQRGGKKRVARRITADGAAARSKKAQPKKKGKT